jgi:hypothetical protein
LKQSLLARYNAFNPDDIERLHKLLPDHIDNVRLVLDLDTLASKHNIALQNVAVARPNEQSSVGNGTIGPLRQSYDSVTLKFATSGTYDRFKTFLLDLEDSLRIVDLTALTMSAEASSAGEPTYRFDVTLRTYWHK